MSKSDSSSKAPIAQPETSEQVENVTSTTTTTTTSTTSKSTSNGKVSGQKRTYSQMDKEITPDPDAPANNNSSSSSATSQPPPSKKLRPNEMDDTSSLPTEEKTENGKQEIEPNDNDADNDDDDNDESELPPSLFLKKSSKKGLGARCPYLDQINRKVLDFDFEKVCSVSMFNHNVYGCLVCGEYFAGRAKGSPAYFHALQENHRIFIHLDHGKIFCLPDDYEVIDPSLNDIKHNLQPSFSGGQISELDTRVEYSHALDGSDYLPGVIGMNNLGETDWLNCVIQSMMRIIPIRNYFLNEANYIQFAAKSPLVRRFGELVRKYFNSKNFKGQVSPHELIQAVSQVSDKKFQIGKSSDPLTFVSWFVNHLHRSLGGSHKLGSSVVSKAMQGMVVVETDYPLIHSAMAEKTPSLIVKRTNEFVTTAQRVPFFYVLLDLPTMPLFKDTQKEKFIPQIPIADLLAKFNNVVEEVSPKTGIKKRYRFIKLPPYLMIAFRRFQENNFFIEKNATIVNFVLKNIDLKPYLFPADTDKHELGKLSVAKLKAKLRRVCKSRGMSADIDLRMNDIVEKSELIDLIIDHFPPRHKWKCKYDLCAQVCHNGEYGKGSSLSFIYHPPNNVWYEVQDLHVQERMTQLVAVSEAYIQLWKRKDSTA